jgi:hypothetical protein
MGECDGGRFELALRLLRGTYRRRSHLPLVGRQQIPIRAVDPAMKAVKRHELHVAIAPDAHRREGAGFPGDRRQPLRH